MSEVATAATTAPLVAGSAPARRPALYGAAAIGALLFAWWLATAIPGFVPSRVLPSPLDVVARFAALIAEPFSGATLFGHALVSLQRWGIGVLLAIGLGRLLMLLIPDMPATIPTWAVVTGLSVSIGVGLIFGVWPAKKAAKLDPIECLRYE